MKRTANKGKALALLLGAILPAFAVFFIAFPVHADVENQMEAGTEVAELDYNATFDFWIGSSTATTVLTGLVLKLGESDASVIADVTCYASQDDTGSQSGCSTTSSRQAFGTISLGGQGAPAIMQFDFASTTDPYYLTSGKWFRVRIYYNTNTSNVGNFDVWGTTGEQFTHQYIRCTSCVNVQSASSTPYFLLNSVFDISQITQYTATSSSLFSGQDATSTLSALTEQCSQAGNLFAEGLCIGFSFLFVPSPSSLAQFTALPQLLGTKFPFSYIAGAISTWDSLVASSTENAPTYTYSLATLGIGSTTPIGNILPDVDVFSSSTVEYFMPAGFLDTFKTFAGIVILLTLIADIFFTSRNLMH